MKQQQKKNKKCSISSLLPKSYIIQTLKEKCILDLMMMIIELNRKNLSVKLKETLQVKFTQSPYTTLKTLNTQEILQLEMKETLSKLFMIQDQQIFGLIVLCVKMKDALTINNMMVHNLQDIEKLVLN